MAKVKYGAAIFRKCTCSPAFRFTFDNVVALTSLVNIRYCLCLDMPCRIIKTPIFNTEKTKNMKELLMITALLMLTIDTLFSQVLFFEQTNHMEFEGQYYDVNYVGLRSFMRDRSNFDPDIYEQLYPDFSIIRGKNQVANSIAFLSLATFGVFGGIAMHQIDNNVDEGVIGRNFAISIGALVAGGISFFLLTPSRSDFMSFITKHNRLFEDRQIKLGLSLAPQGQPGVGLVLQF